MKQERNQGGNVKFSAMRDGVHLRASDMERWLSFQQVFLKRSCVKGPCKYDVRIIFGFLNPAPHPPCPHFTQPISTVCPQNLTILQPFSPLCVDVICIWHLTSLRGVNGLNRFFLGHKHCSISGQRNPGPRKNSTQR